MRASKTFRAGVLGLQRSSLTAKGCTGGGKIMLKFVPTQLEYGEEFTLDVTDKEPHGYGINR